MTDIAAKCIREQPRFRGIKKFENKVSLSSPVIHGDGIELIKKIFTPEDNESKLEKVGEWDAGKLEETGVQNTHRLEKEVACYVGMNYAVGLNSGTAAIHLAIKLAAEKIYGSAGGNFTLSGWGKGSVLLGHQVFCPDFAPISAVNPILYEGGDPIFIDVSPEDWCMDPEVLEIAFNRYPDVRIVIMSHIYGFPGQVKRIKEICREHEALLIEDASESFGAAIDGQNVGAFGDYSVLSFESSRIITGGCGGMLLTDDVYSAKKAAYWASFAKARAPWNQYEEPGYCYEMDDITAAIIRGQLRHLPEHITRKKEIYKRYLKKLDSSVICMNPVGEGVEPNYWMSCMLSESNIVFQETRSERDYTYTNLHGTAAPMEIYDALQAFGVQSSPVYKPMHMQPVFQNCDQVTLDGSRWIYQDFYQDDFWVRCNESKHIFEHGLCLPSNIRMTDKEQDRVIDIVNACFCGQNMERKIWESVNEDYGA